MSYAGVVTQNPGGTGNPARTSSPRFAAFPPATASASLSIAAKGMMNSEIGTSNLELSARSMPSSNS
jgi:hypothetical protein